MKILYTADCHEDIDFMRNAGEFGLEQKVDLWLANGDFLNSPWATQEVFQKYIKVLQEMYNEKARMKSNFSLLELASLFSAINSSDYHKKLGEDYLNLVEIAKESMKEKYIEMSKAIFDNFENPSMVLPGNYDSEEMMKEIFGDSLHLQKKEIKCNGSVLTISGYGGANEWPIQIPYELTVPFKETENYDAQGKLIGGDSEAVGFFRENPSDIIITHVPPKNFLDYILNGQSAVEGRKEIHGGNRALDSYLAELKQRENKGDKMPLLWLFGHMHSSVVNRGAKKYGNTLLLNPGSISRYRSAVQGTGTFAIIELDVNTKDRKFEKATIYGIEESPREIIPVEEYTVTERGLNKLELLKE